MKEKVQIGYAKLRWWKLRENCCPKCGKEFFKHGSITKETVSCKCGFFISMEKYQKIVNDQNTKDVDQKLDQLEMERHNV